MKRQHANETLYGIHTFFDDSVKFREHILFEMANKQSPNADQTIVIACNRISVQRDSLSLFVIFPKLYLYTS